eukprot:1160449-Pelagomonas_calceolata.AAC.18
MQSSALVEGKYHLESMLFLEVTGSTCPQTGSPCFCIQSAHWARAPSRRPAAQFPQANACHCSEQSARRKQCMQNTLDPHLTQVFFSAPSAVCKRAAASHLCDAGRIRGSTQNAHCCATLALLTMHALRSKDTLCSAQARTFTQDDSCSRQ